ncbi:MAG: hypothetical protein ACRD1E_03695, partial [Terriglobales bacterium]
ITLWGMVMITALLLVGWVAGTAVQATSGLAGGALGAASSNRAASVQGVLQSNGINLTQAQATTISNQMLAGDRAGASSTLAGDANITSARANDILGQVSTPVAGAATTAGQAVKHGGGGLSWGIFWISLIGLGVALLGGAVGGGGMALRRGPRTSKLPA